WCLYLGDSDPRALLIERTSLGVVEVADDLDLPASAFAVQISCKAEIGCYLFGPVRLTVLHPGDIIVLGPGNSPWDNNPAIRHLATMREAALRRGWFAKRPT